MDNTTAFHSLLTRLFNEDQRIFLFYNNGQIYFKNIKNDNKRDMTRFFFRSILTIFFALVFMVK